MRTAVQSRSFYKPILVKNLIFFIKLTIIETVFHILNRNLPSKDRGLASWLS
jgi:hypothetical protein